jgi:hypothetical protein
MMTTAERVDAMLADVLALEEQVAAQLADARWNEPHRVRKLTAALDDLRRAKAGLVAVRPTTQTDFAKYVDAFSQQRARQTRRSELLEGLVDGDGSRSEGRAASR